MRRIVIGTLLLLLGATTVAVATEPGPAVGDVAPDFTLKTSTGETLRLSQETAERPVVLVFFRGAW